MLTIKKMLKGMGMGSKCGTRGAGVQQHHESLPSHSPHIVGVGNH